MRGDADALGGSNASFLGGEVVLLCADGQRLCAGRYQLAAASPAVLRGALELPLEELRVDEGRSAWAAALQLLRLDAYDHRLVTWANVESLLRLGDKYDMPLLRGSCGEFVRANMRDLSLDQPLESPRHTLRTASLLVQYGGSDVTRHVQDVKQRLSSQVTARLRAAAAHREQRIPLLSAFVAARLQAAPERRPTSSQARVMHTADCEPPSIAQQLASWIAALLQAAVNLAEEWTPQYTGWVAARLQSDPSHEQRMLLLEQLLAQLQGTDLVAQDLQHELGLTLAKNLRHFVGGDSSLVERASAASGSASAAPRIAQQDDEPLGGEVLLVCGDGGKRLRAGRYQLAAASPKMRVALEQGVAGGSEEDGGGADTTATKELRVDEPSGVWETALRMLRLDTHALPLVTWDNVEELLRLGHKYDMPLLRGCCAHFFCNERGSMGLAQPLDSPRNILRALSLLHTCGDPSVAHYTAATSWRLHYWHLESLMQASLVRRQCLSQLEQLMSHPRYTVLVANVVQRQVTSAVMNALRQFIW